MNCAQVVRAIEALPPFSCTIDTPAGCPSNQTLYVGANVAFIRILLTGRLAFALQPDAFVLTNCAIVDFTLVRFNEPDPQR